VVDKDAKALELESKKRERAMRFNAAGDGSVPPLSAVSIAAEEEKYFSIFDLLISLLHIFFIGKDDD